MNFDALGWGNYLIFIVLAVIIVLASITVSYIVDTIGKRTRFSGALVAGTLVAFVSSLPEFTSSLVAVLTDHKFDSAAGNLIGGNIFRTFMLGVALLLFIYCMKKAKTTSTQVFLVCAQVFVSIVFIFSMAFHDSFADMSYYVFVGADILVILLYVATIFFMVRKDDNENEGMKIEPNSNRLRRWLMKVQLSKVMVTFVIASLVIIGSAFCIALSTESIKGMWGMDGEGKSAFGSSILLGIVTSIPELVTVITLLRLKDVDAAITDILGSNLFSLFIMGFIDLVTMADQTGDMWGKDAMNILFWFVIEVLFIAGLLLVNYLYRKKKVKPTKYYVLVVTCLVATLSCYVISIFQESGFIPIIPIY